MSSNSNYSKNNNNTISRRSSPAFAPYNKDSPPYVRTHDGELVSLDQLSENIIHGYYGQERRLLKIDNHCRVEEGRRPLLEKQQQLYLPRRRMNDNDNDEDDDDDSFSDNDHIMKYFTRTHNPNIKDNSDDDDDDENEENIIEKADCDVHDDGRDDSFQRWVLKMKTYDRKEEGRRPPLYKKKQQQELKYQFLLLRQQLDVEIKKFSTKHDHTSKKTATAATKGGTTFDTDSISYTRDELIADVQREVNANRSNTNSNMARAARAVVDNDNVDDAYEDEDVDDDDNEDDHKEPAASETSYEDDDEDEEEEVSSTPSTTTSSSINTGEFFTPKSSMSSSSSSSSSSKKASSSPPTLPPPQDRSSSSLSSTNNFVLRSTQTLCYNSGAFYKCDKCDCYHQVQPVSEGYALISGGDTTQVLYNYRGGNIDDNDNDNDNDYDYDNGNGNDNNHKNDETNQNDNNDDN